jgi:hypothetical protein
MPFPFWWGRCGEVRPVLALTTAASIRRGEGIPGVGALPGSQAQFRKPGSVVNMGQARIVPSAQISDHQHRHPLGSALVIRLCGRAMIGRVQRLIPERARRPLQGKAGRWTTGFPACGILQGRPSSSHTSSWVQSYTPGCVKICLGRVRHRGKSLCEPPGAALHL